MYSYIVRIVEGARGVGVGVVGVGTGESHHFLSSKTMLGEHSNELRAIESWGRQVSCVLYFRPSPVLSSHWYVIHWTPSLYTYNAMYVINHICIYLAQIRVMSIYIH